MSDLVTVYAPGEGGSRSIYLATDSVFTELTIRDAEQIAADLAVAIQRAKAA